MRPSQVALIAVAVVLLILAVYVLFAKPTVVLPSIPISIAGAAPLKSIVESQNASGLDVRVRTNGKIIAEVAGKQLAQVDYNPQTLGNSVGLVERMAVPQTASAAVRLTPALIPGLRTLLLNSALTMYYLLPVELNLKLIPG
ncbi:MAG: hypothetical protein IT331_17295 [Anaerolineae bacterium]|nr:hypothetical protein [Anaerolineae bacterium]